jgi:hypothetical protein
MARIRSIKPEYWADQDLAEQVSRDARLLYIGLWNLADEHSRLRGDPRFIKGQVFPYDDDLGPAEVEALLDELAAAEKVVRFRAASGTYVFLPNLAEHQRLEPSKVATKLPGPDDPGSVLLPPKTTIGPDAYESRAGKIARDSDESARGTDESALLYGTGSMEHVSPSSAPPTETDPDGLFDAGSEPLRPSTAPKRSWTNDQIDADPHFVAFWEAYPRKTDKGHARKAWLRRIREGIPPEQLTAAAAAFRDDPKRPRDIKFVPHPTTWLNGERYNDYNELTQAAPVETPWWDN